MSDEWKLLHDIRNMTATEPMTLAQKDAVLYATDRIIETIGTEHIKLFLPMNEKEGTALKCLINPQTTFQMNGVTLGGQGLLGTTGKIFDGINDYCIQNPITGLSNMVTGSSMALNHPDAVAVQKLAPASGITAEIGYITIPLQITGSPNGSVRLEIRTDPKDSGTVIANGTSNAISYSQLYSGGYNTFVFPASPLYHLTAVHHLCLVLRDNTNADDSNNVAWMYDPAGGYGQGYNFYNGVAWDSEDPVVLGKDFAFRVFSDFLRLEDDIGIVTAFSPNSILPSNSLFNAATTHTLRPTISMTSLGALMAGFLDTDHLICSTHKTVPNNFNVSVATFDRSESTGKAKAYLNGRLVATVNGTADAAHRDIRNPWMMGASQIANSLNRSAFFGGIIGPIIMTNSVLTAEQVGAITSDLLVLRKLGVNV